MLPLVLGADGLIEEWMAWALFAGPAIDGNKTVSGTETMTATHYWDVLTVPNGTTLITDGYCVYANKIVISGTGRIHNNGTNPGTPDLWSPGLGRSSREAGGSGTGQAGIGNPNTGAGVNGLSGSTVSVGAGGTGGASGAGGAGNGGAGGAGAAGAGFINAALAGYPRLTPNLTLLRANLLIAGGCGGAAGATGGGNGSWAYSGGTSAGGGAGGGVLCISCGELDISAAQAGCIQAKGSSCQNTSAASTGGTNAGGAGGSGGGGGGYIYMLVGKITGAVTNALDAGGGNGGPAGNANGGSSAAGTGGSGGKGGNIDVFHFAAGLWLTARGAAGAAGSAPSGATGGAGGAGGACLLSL